MPSERYFASIPFCIGHTVVIEDAEHHHLARVMRTATGDEVELVNGQGELAAAEVLAIEKNVTQLRIKDLFKQPKPAEVILAQALPKLPRLELIAEKGTELGMTQLWLFAGQKSEKKELNEHQQQRLKAHMIAAMKQSGRLYLPELKLVLPLLQWNQEFKGLSFFGEFVSGTPLLREIWDLEKAKRGVLVVIGPESGFSPAEKQKLQSLGMSGACFNSNVLRAETAPLAVLAIVQHLLM